MGLIVATRGRVIGSMAVLVALACGCGAPLPETPRTTETAEPASSATELIRTSFDLLRGLPPSVKDLVADCAFDKLGAAAWQRLTTELTATAGEREVVAWCTEVAEASSGMRDQALPIVGPADQAVEMRVGPVLVSTWSPVTVTPFDSGADVFLTLRNDGTQTATVHVDATAANRAAREQADAELHVLHETIGARWPDLPLAPIRLRPGRSTTVQFRVGLGPRETGEPLKVALSFTFQVEGTPDRGTLTVEGRAEPSANFSAYSKSSHISGRVLGPDGTGIGGALVQLWVGMGIADPISFHTWTDGTFRVAVPSGPDLRTILGPRRRVWPASAMTYSVGVSAPGFTYGYRAGLDPKTGETASTDVTLRPLAPVGYKLVGAYTTDSPIGFWQVRWAGSGDLVVATEGRHPPSLDIPAHIFGIDLSGRERWRIQTGNECWGLDVSQDGDLIAAGCADALIYVATAQGKLLHTIAGGYGAGGDVPFQPRFSPDGRLLLVDTTKGLAVIEPRSGAVKWRIRDFSHQVRNARWSRDGKRLVVADEAGTLAMFDESGRELWRTWAGHVTFGLEIDEAYNVYDANKTGLFMAYDADGNVRWQWGLSSYGGPHQMTEDGEAIVVMQGGIKKIAVLLDGSGGLVWDHHFGQAPDAERAGGGGHNAIDMTPDGSLIALGFEDYELMVLDRAGDVLWTDREEPRPEVEASVSRNAPGVQGVTISSDGRYIVAAYADGMIRIFERQ